MGKTKDIAGQTFGLRGLVPRDRKGPGEAGVREVVVWLTDWSQVDPGWLVIGSVCCWYWLVAVAIRVSGWLSRENMETRAIVWLFSPLLVVFFGLVAVFEVVAWVLSLGIYPFLASFREAE